MKKRKTLIAAVACLVLAIVIVPVAAYAWFTSGSRTPVDLELLEINSTVTLYRSNDSNSNGIPDRAGTPEKMKYYDEIYDFVDPQTDYAVSEETHADVKLTASVGSIFPGEACAFKFAVENNGDADNAVRLALDFATVTADSDRNLLKALSVTVAGVAKNGGYSLEKTRKTYLYDLRADDTAEVFDFRLAGLVTAYKNNDKTENCYDFWFVIKMEPLEEVNAHIAGTDPAAAPITEAEYAALEGASVKDFTFKVYFDVTSDLMS